MRRPAPHDTTLFVQRSRLAASAAEVFEWHARPGAFERLTPPWEHVRVLEKHGGIENGARLVMQLGPGGFGPRWVADHCDTIPGEQFRDVQTSGPFAFWEHTHRFEPAGPDACWLDDRIEYQLPGGALGALAAGAFTQRKLQRMFEYRHRITAGDVAAHARARAAGPLKILVTGSTGLIGSALVPYLTTGGHAVTRLIRSGRRADAIVWEPATGTIDRAALEGFDAVIHLAGESVAGGRWTAEKKARIRSSRREDTRALVTALTNLAAPPKVLVVASAIGFYGDRGAELLREDRAPGTGFLAEVCQEWEAATAPAAAHGMRVVNLRLGVVLSAAGGALATMLTPFSLGLGGAVGDGSQYLSWIALDDVLDAALYACTTPTVAGPVNVVAPNPVPNREFTATLGRVLARPAVVSVPALAVRLLFGEMGDELLLASTRVEPARLTAAGFSFRYADLEPALRHLLGRS